MDSLNSAAGKCPYRLQNALIDGATFLLHFLFEIGMKKGLQKVFIAPFLKKRRYRLCIFVYMRHCVVGMIRGGIFNHRIYVKSCIIGHFHQSEALI